MSRAWLVFLAAVLTVAALFVAAQRHLEGAWFALGTHPEVITQLEQALEDQKELARLDPESEAERKRHFEEIHTLLGRLRILEHNRLQLVERYRQLLLTVLAGAIGLLGTLLVVHHRRREQRLGRLQHALAKLAEGRTDLSLGDRSSDTIGRIAAMVERTSQVMARDRRRLRTLENLSAWQEAARRHAHEMRTPLTGARLEINRLDALLEREGLEAGGDLRQAARGAYQELERLGRFAQEFTSFARLPRPEPRSVDLEVLLRELVTTYDAAWNNLDLTLEVTPGGPYEGTVDRDLLRQVLVNLCDNSSLSLRETKGTVRLVLGGDKGQVEIAVADDGPGIEESIRPRLFEPYTTTRGIGQGMGLGLAISKKILLDHGGDLELATTSEAGTTFRLTLPRKRQAEAVEAASESHLVPLRRAEA